jgi:membrane-bound metal-dependent hydrolase YbcI (DUF457 family)
MMGVTHRLSGAVVWTAGCAGLAQVGHAPGLVPTVAGAVLCGVGALLPDLDHPQSMASRSLGWVSRLVSAGVRLGCGHRGPTHWGIVGVMLGLAVGALAALVEPSLWWVGLAVGAGHVVHVLGDCLTDAGAPLFGPWCRRPVGVWVPLRFKTGRRGCRVELWLVRPVLVAAGVVSVLALVG